MAKAVGVSESTVGKIWRVHGLKPHLSRTFKLSNDKRFAEKLEDVVGLYLIGLPLGLDHYEWFAFEGLHEPVDQSLG